MEKVENWEEKKENCEREGGKVVKKEVRWNGNFLPEKKQFTPGKKSGKVT